MVFLNNMLYILLLPPCDNPVILESLSHIFHDNLGVWMLVRYTNLQSVQYRLVFVDLG
jgi:hypothetical protein